MMEINNCDCSKYVCKTIYDMISRKGFNYDIYRCQNCGTYYAKNDYNNSFVEVFFDEAGDTWLVKNYRGKTFKSNR